MAVSFTKINDFVQRLATEDLDLDGSGLTLALTNTAVNATATSISGVSQISYTHLPTARTLTVSSATQTSGTFKLVLADKTLTADGTVPAFRYVVLFDDASTEDRLIGLYDYGSSINMTSGDTLTTDFDATNGVLTIA